MIVPFISSRQPQAKISFDINSQIPRHPDWVLPNRIDALIGAGTLSMLVTDGMVHLGSETAKFLAQNSTFGWIITGVCTSQAPTYSFECNLVNDTLDACLQQFWEIPDHEKPSLTLEQRFAEDNFVQTFERDSSGRYIVTIPLRTDIPKHGRSRHIAMHS